MRPVRLGLENILTLRVIKNDKLKHNKSLIIKNNSIYKIINYKIDGLLDKY